MKNQELIKKAVCIHFAITNKRTLSCDITLEDYADIANDFLRYFLTGNLSIKLDKNLDRARYQTKKKLIERYIKQRTSKKD